MKNEINYLLNTCYSKGGIWSEGSWSTVEVTEGVAVSLFHREKDIRFTTTKEKIQTVLEQLNRAAFLNDSEWFGKALSYIYNN